MANRLKDLEIEWASLVDSPANKSAVITFCKRRDDSPPETKKKGPIMSVHDLDVMIEKCAKAEYPGDGVAAAVAKYLDTPAGSGFYSARCILEAAEKFGDPLDGVEVLAKRLGGKPEDYVRAFDLVGS